LSIGDFRLPINGRVQIGNRQLEIGNRWGIYAERQHYVAMHRVQEPELRHYKEQEEDAGSPRVQEVL
jgi:hypothetical protein